MEKNLDFPGLIDRIHAADPNLNYRPGCLPFQFRGREVDIRAEAWELDKMHQPNCWGFREIGFFHASEAGHGGPEITARYTYPKVPDSPTRDTVDEATGSMSALVITTRMERGGKLNCSPLFAVQDRTFTVGGKTRVFRQFDPNDPFVRLLDELLTATENPVDVQKGIAEAVKKLGIGL